MPLDRLPNDLRTAFGGRGLSGEFARFLVVGAGNTLIAYGLFALFVGLGLHYVAATIIAGGLSVTVGFFTSSYFVFLNEDYCRILRFFVVYGIVCMINLGVQKLLKLTVVETSYITGALATPIGTALAFVVNRRFVVRRR
jgi:putative flippase GtrA